MSRAVVVLLFASVAACATTDPYRGASIDYRLPRTDATVTVGLNLRSCAPFKVDADIGVVPEAGAQTGIYRLSGEDLASASIKRDVAVSLSEAGVILGVNTVNVDKTPEIIGNVLKTAGTIASTMAPGAAITRPSEPPPTPPPLACTQEVEDALTRANWLRSEIKQLRAASTQPPGARDPAVAKAINRYAREYAALEEGLLRVDTTGEIKLDRTPSDATRIPATALEMDWEPFQKWFERPSPADVQAQEAQLAKTFGMIWQAELLPNATPLSQPVLPKPKSLRQCGFAMAVPAVASVRVEVSEAGTALPDIDLKKVLPAAQWAEAGKLCLDVGFGESRSVALDFDKYGRTTEFAWSSDATAATVTGAVAGYATEVEGLVATLEGPDDLTKKKAEIDEIETDQKLEELRRCKRIREAGGDCNPEE